jgi:hypothetical protein
MSVFTEAIHVTLADGGDPLPTLQFVAERVAVALVEKGYKVAQRAPERNYRRVDGVIEWIDLIYMQFRSTYDENDEGYFNVSLDTIAGAEGFLAEIPEARHYKAFARRKRSKLHVAH